MKQSLRISPGEMDLASMYLYHLIRSHCSVCVPRLFTLTVEETSLVLIQAQSPPISTSIKQLVTGFVTDIGMGGAPTQDLPEAGHTHVIMLT